MKITVPELSMIVLAGVSGSGKSTLARRLFRSTQVISSDFCRALVSDDENDQSATPDAFDVLHYIVGTRLRRGLLTVVDATNVQADARKQLIAVAREHNVLVDVIVLEVPEQVAIERNRARSDRDFGDHVVRRQAKDLRRSRRFLNKEGFRKVHVLRGVEEIDAAEIGFERAWTDKRDLTGPFDIIGDIHGCRSELNTLLASLGWKVEGDTATHPQGRTAVFVGDLVDRGPDSPGVLRLVIKMVAAGNALCVAGNHEVKLVRALRGRKVRVAHGLEASLEQLAAEPEEFRREATDFMDRLISHYQLDEGRLVVAHAGLKESYHGRASGRVRAFALYGDTTGETDEYGLPVRYPWARDYRGRAMVAYGHTPVPEAEWVNNTICLDTGCVFGGKLTGLRYPERELVSVPAEREWYEPARPLVPAAPARDRGTLDIGDVTGTRHIETRHHGRIKIREENSAAALEIMSRFAVDPRWLIYLPPTMAPAATTSREGLLEHPAEAFAQFAADGVEDLVCEEKHMGSRAVAVLCRDEATAAARFGVTEGTGVLYTRTGRSFWSDGAMTDALLDRVRAAADAAGLWDELATGWLALDCELLPWSAKAKELIRAQYAAVGAAARTALPEAIAALEATAARGLDVGDLLDRTRRRAANAGLFRDAFAAYCWPVAGLDGVRLAPFQILAFEGEAAAVRPHAWHLEVIDRLCAADESGLLKRTGRVFARADDPAQAISWWEDLTAAGGEGMVVKPAASLVRTDRGLLQPGVKVRGREYLRIIYGPDYTDDLDQLRGRHLGRKRSMALREYALGLEALSRLADGEPLWRIHQAVFGVLALESEPVDPRL